MPNLVPPVVSSADALSYRDRILAASGPDFQPLMTLYLTEQTQPDDVTAGAASGLSTPSAASSRGHDQFRQRRDQR